MLYLGGGFNMFLTRKDLTKIRILTGLYIGLGTVSFIFYFLFSLEGISAELFVLLGILSFVLSILSFVSGRYGEGTAKLLKNGNKLVYKQLRPAEFIKQYEAKRYSPENIVSKPDFNVLSLVVLAYDILGDTEQKLITLEELIATAPEKKKNIAKLHKAAVLFDLGNTEEADRIFSEVQSGKMNAIAKAVADTVLKTDRAMALGDYKTAETYNRQLLARSFPKQSPLSLLVINFNLAKICLNTGRADEAKTYYLYCAEHGGETAVKTEAEQILETL